MCVNYYYSVLVKYWYECLCMIFVILNFTFSKNILWNFTVSVVRVVVMSWRNLVECASELFSSEIEIVYRWQRGKGGIYIAKIEFTDIKH